MLSLPCVLEYVEQLLRQYAARLDFEPQARPDWPLHRLNVTLKHFVNVQTPSVETCRPYF